MLLGGTWAQCGAADRPGEQDNTDPLQAHQSRIQQVIAESEPAVVAIARAAVDADPVRVAQGWSGIQEFASGILIDRSGLVLTNHHVLGNTAPASYMVWVQGRAYHPVKVLAADPWSDLAVLKLPAEAVLGPTWEPIPWGDSDRLQKGQYVIGLGNPFATARSGEPSAALGIVSHLRRPPHERPNDGPAPQGSGDELGDSPTWHHHGTLIESDLRITHLTSGGALVDLDGKLVGLITTLPTGGSGAAGTWGIPVDATFRRVVEDLVAGQEVEYGYLGVGLQGEAPEITGAVDSPQAKRQTTPQGVRLQEVLPGSAAARYGLRSGDQLAHLQQQAVSTPADLMRQLSRFRPGDVVRLGIQRYDSVLMDFRTLEFEVRLDKWPLPPGLKGTFTTPPPRWRGMRVEYASVAPREALPSQPGLPIGVYVEQVEPESIAWRSGVRNGMVVSHLDGESVQDPKQFWRYVGQHTGTIALKVIHPAPVAGVMSVPSESP